MEKARVTPVAVIGLACRLPGGISSPDQLWQALLRGEDFVTEVPLDRWDIDEYYDPEPGVPGRSHCKWGAFMDNLGDFDPEFFGISEREAIAMDPQHRLLLETSWEAMEHAGLAPAQMADSLTGVFIGFTISQTGLVKHWFGARTTGWQWKAALNGFDVKDVSQYYTNDLIAEIDDFDAEKIRASAKSYTG